MSSSCAFLRLPNDLFDATSAGYYIPGRVSHLKYLCLHSNIFRSLFSQNAVAVTSRSEKEEIVRSVVGVLDQIQSIGHLVVELAADPLDPALKESILNLVEKAKIREIHIVEHTDHSFANEEPTSNQQQQRADDESTLSPEARKRNAQLRQLGEGMRRNPHIQKICIWDGPVILSSLAPNPTLQELDVSLIDSKITRTVIDAIPRMTKLRKLVLQTSEFVGLPPRPDEWKSALLRAIQKCPKLDNVVTDGRIPILDYDKDKKQIDRWIQRNRAVSYWQEGGCQPPSSNLLPNLLANIQDMATANDVVFRLLAGEPGWHTDLLSDHRRRSREEEEEPGALRDKTRQSKRLRTR